VLSPEALPVAVAVPACRVAVVSADRAEVSPAARERASAENVTLSPSHTALAVTLVVVSPAVLTTEAKLYCVCWARAGMFVLSAIVDIPPDVMFPPNA